MSTRTAQIDRATGETRITLKLKIDGKGKSSIDTGIPFFDHMLTLFAKHAVCDLQVQCDGDLDVDLHTPWKMWALPWGRRTGRPWERTRHPALWHGL